MSKHTSSKPRQRNVRQPEPVYVRTISKPKREPEHVRVRVVTRAQLRRTAIHEAGHAVIGRVLTLLCGGASIRPDYNTGEAGHAITADPLLSVGAWNERCKWRTGDAVYRARIITFMAGAEAEAALLGSAAAGDGDDRYQIDMMAEQCDRCDLDRLRKMTRMLVRRHRPRIERVAAALEVNGRLTQRRIDELAGRSVDDVPDRSLFRWAP